jgi:hypothetical protein
MPGWVGVHEDWNGRMSRWLDYRDGDIPGFELSGLLSIQPGKVQRLPQPQVPFGLITGDFFDSPKSVVTELAGFRQLRMLRVSRVNPVGLRELRSFTQLTHLELLCAEPTDEDFAVLGNLSCLQVLEIEHPKATNAGWQQLDRHPALRVLTILDGFHTVSEDAVKGIRRMKGLRVLSLDCVKVTRAALAELAGLEGLTSLSILGIGTSIPDGALLELARLKTLSYLDLRGASRSASDLARLRELMPWCKIDAISQPPRWPPRDSN